MKEGVLAIITISAVWLFSNIAIASDRLPNESNRLVSCTGTYYAVEGGASPTGYSTWTFHPDGSMIVSSSAEPIVPFSTAHGNWKVSPRRSTVQTVTFDFSGGVGQSTHPHIVRVESTFQFKRDCSATLPGQSEFTVISCPVAEGPFCANSTTLMEKVPVELTRISGGNTTGRIE